ncbi:MAG: hypothetical protein A2297_03555 [Elusimicrobia bacterium RIFOXYB2_FULL_48_7]|nr:MAG: hypothetical protein A2297_03555 [Elusimicrobia bacterium RIFOXYB2_FULL_48_7]
MTTVIIRIVFWLAALYCTVFGFLVLFFPKQLIKINDWLTVKTLLQETSGMLFRIVIGAVFLAIAGIFWWSILN